MDQNSNEETQNKQTKKKTTQNLKFTSKSGTETMNTHLFIYIKTEMSVECF